MGRELYGVRLIDEQDERPDRTVLGGVDYFGIPKFEGV